MANVFHRTTFGIAGAAAAFATVLTAPAATAADQSANPLAPHVKQAGMQAATLCGSDYKFINAVALPADYRFATLFYYNKSGEKHATGRYCAILDNNVGATRYMRLQLCANDGTCATDAGMFSQYAGPVYKNLGLCGVVKSFMENSDGPLVNDERGITLCD